MSLSNLAYGEFIDLIAGGTTPQKIIEFTPSTAAKEKVAELIHKQKVEGLTADEEEELSHFLHVEHILRMAKARAREHLRA